MTTAIAGGCCLVEMSSALVEHLEDTEQAFVIGHEIGHFLLDHHYLPLPAVGSVERYALLRAREVSADRMGLIACGSAEAAMRAVIKTFSGLSESSLRFDAGAFLRSCFDAHNRMQMLAGFTDTHPSFGVRARFLVHFSSIATSDRGQSWRNEFDRIEDRVYREHLLFSEENVETHFEQLNTNLAQWIWISGLASIGTVTKEQMHLLELRFGADFASRIRTNLADMPRQGVRDLAESNLRDTFQAFKTAFPWQIVERTSQLVDECSLALGLSVGSHQVLEMMG